MKTITVGDLHGLNVWKKINPDDFDLIVFIGDYTDSFTCTDTEILENLMDIIVFAKAYPDKVILLLGNHDCAYIKPCSFNCSGFRPSMAVSLEILFQEHRSLFKIAHQVGNVLWTHAGISQGWYDKHKEEIKPWLLEGLDLAAVLNQMYETGHGKISLSEISQLRGGSKMFSGPLWADKRELSNSGHMRVFYNFTEQNMPMKPIPGYHQIVGHTALERIETIEIDDTTKITFVDVLGIGYHENRINFFELEIN